MRISDWSSDVCSSDLIATFAPEILPADAPAELDVAKPEIILCDTEPEVVDVDIAESERDNAEPDTKEAETSIAEPDADFSEAEIADSELEAAETRIRYRKFTRLNSCH